jgi:diacylglycerol O-acyltransferase
MNIALVEFGSLMLHASRRSTVLPNMGLVLRFPEGLTAEELETEARRLASPYGLGRRLAPPRVPGARPRWVPAPEPPPVALAPPREDARSLERWLADELSVRHDPQDDAGWRLAATRDAHGATVVALTLNHLFGTGRDLATTLYGGELVEHSNGDEAPPYDVTRELLDVGSRFGRGTLGVLRLGRDVALAPMRRDPYGSLADLRKPVAALRDRDPSRGRPSARRVGAVLRVDAAAWAKAAKRNGGTRTALQVAVAANLLRGARRARGGATERALRLIVPVDLADRSETPQAAATVGPIRLTSASVVLAGGAPQHGDLAPVRAELQRAIDDSVRQIKATGRVPVAPGVVDALKLLPDAVTARVMFGVHAGYDGAVSNVGALPPGIRRIGEHVASDAFLMAFPLGSDLALAFGRQDGDVTLGAVADPSRLGGGPPLQERLAEELAAWDLPTTDWNLR